MLADLIFDFLQGGNKLNNILSMFGDLFGGMGGGSKKGSSQLMFAGPMDYLQAVPVSGGAAGPFDYLQYADGGHIAAGKSGITGEAGPELISGPATVTPMADLGSKPNVNITIQSIDTQTGTEFLLKNKKQIEGIIQNAYNRRGKQGIY